MKNPINIFISYTHTDEEFMKRLKNHFVTKERNNQVKIWSDTNIEAGIELWEEINSNFNKSNIVLTLISVDYLNSKSCVNGELTKALNRRKSDKNFRVIPIIVRPCDWVDFENLGTYKALPHDGYPISKFETQDDAYCQIVKAISEIIEKGISIELGEQEIPDDDFLVKILYNILSIEPKISNKGISMIKYKNQLSPIISFSFPHDNKKRKYKVDNSFTETKFNLAIETLISLNWIISKPCVENQQEYTLIQYQLNPTVNHQFYAEKLLKILINKGINKEFTKIPNNEEQMSMFMDLNNTINKPR